MFSERRKTGMDGIFEAVGDDRNTQKRSVTANSYRAVSVLGKEQCQLAGGQLYEEWQRGSVIQDSAGDSEETLLPWSGILTRDCFGGECQL